MLCSIFSAWCKARKFSINIDETKLTMYYSTSKNWFMLTKFQGLCIDVIAQKQEIVIEFLVVFFDENGTWKTHINIISIKIFKSTGIFYRWRLMIRKEQLNQLYLSFVDSYLNFANFALESTWKANCRLELSNCQGKCSMKLPSFKNQFTH